MPLIHKYMERVVYPSYPAGEQHEGWQEQDVVDGMRKSITSRIDKRAKGHNSLLIEFAHPLLYARELGVTVEGSDRWTPRGKFLVIPFERALLSEALAPLVIQRKAAIEERQNKRAQKMYDKKYTRQQRSTFNRGGLKAQKLSEVRESLGSTPDSERFLFFKSLSVIASPFMHEIDAIVYDQSNIYVEPILADIVNQLGRRIGEVS